MRYVETTRVGIAELAPYPGNARTHDESALDESVEVNGQYRSVVARRLGADLQLLAGHGTVNAFARRGDTDVRVEVIEADDTEARRIVLADNATSRNAGYDEKLLLDLIEQASKDGGLPGTGWDEAAYRELLDQMSVALPTVEDPDAVPDLPTEPRSVLGDVWVLGPHRVACGDSTDALLWERILEGDRPAVVFTDPPYGIAYKAMRGGRDIANDSDAGRALQVAQDALSLFSDAPVHFVCCDWRSLPTMTSAMLEAAIEPKACIVWDKQRRVQNLDRYAKRHEFILYAGPYGGQPTVETDIWSVPRDFDPDHPTPKPVELISKALTTSSSPGSLVVDPFGGSGSTLIAAHVTGRAARLIELDPRYVDVICRRYQEATGDKPILEATGEPHDFTTDA